MTDFRALCAELADELERCRPLAEVPDCLARARAALAQPEPEVVGEVGKLVAWLREQATWFTADDPGHENYDRAADLLEQRHPAPVPVAERLPGPGDCDAEGRCWWGFEETDDYDAGWTLRKMIGLPFDDTHWLPATALPLPQGEVQP